MREDKINMEAATSHTAKARKGTPERILVALVVALNAVAIICFAIGTWMSLTGELPCPKNHWCIFRPNTYGNWPFGMDVLGFVATLFALPANIMFMIRVRRPAWVYVPIVITILFSVIMYFFQPF